MKPSRALIALCVFVCLALFACNDMNLNAPAEPKAASVAQTGAMKNDFKAEAEKSEEDEPAVAMDQRVDLPALRGRKMIREGHVSMRVKDLDESRGALTDLVTNSGGFISNVYFNRTGTNHRMELTFRIPSEGFLEFVASLREMGTILSENIESKDVTDQWVDLGRRIETKEKLATRLEELIRNKSYQFRDLLKVEEELARLRLEIEQLKGSLRGLDDRIALSTLVVELHQEVGQKIVAPDSVFAPMINAIENAGPRLQGSFRGLLAAVAALMNLFIVLLPWVIPGLLVFYGSRAAIRRMRSTRKKKC